MRIRELFRRNLADRIEGVVKVFDRQAIRQELMEYVVTDSVERNLRRFLDAFVESLDARRGGKGLDGMAAWVSGFFGSGKSHFAKILGYLLENPVVDEANQQRAIDLFLPQADAGETRRPRRGGRPVPHLPVRESPRCSSLTLH